MPRYFFHLHDGADIPDNDGAIFENAAAARAQAIATAGSMLKDLNPNFVGRLEWRMTVIAEAGDTVCALHFTAECI